MFFRTGDNENGLELQAFYQRLALVIQAVGLDDEKFGIRMVDDEFDLAWRRVGAARNADRAQGLQGQIGDNPGVAVV